MSFSKNDLETIKSKIKLSNEIGKKTKIIKRVMIIGAVVHFMMKSCIM